MGESGFAAGGASHFDEDEDRYARQVGLKGEKFIVLTSGGIFHIFDYHPCWWSLPVYGDESYQHFMTTKRNQLRVEMNQMMQADSKTAGGGAASATSMFSHLELERRLNDMMTKVEKHFKAKLEMKLTRQQFHESHLFSCDSGYQHYRMRELREVAFSLPTAQHNYALMSLGFGEHKVEADGRDPRKKVIRQSVHLGGSNSRQVYGRSTSRQLLHFAFAKHETLCMWQDAVSKYCDGMQQVQMRMHPRPEHV